MPGVFSIAFPFAQQDGGQRSSSASSESSNQIHQITPSSDTPTDILCNVQDYDTLTQSFFDIQPWHEYATTAASSNSGPLFLEQGISAVDPTEFLESSLCFAASPDIICNQQQNIPNTQIQFSQNDVMLYETPCLAPAKLMSSSRRQECCHILPKL